jgi:P pilus assembly chaperone PapD
MGSKDMRIAHGSLGVAFILAVAVLSSSAQAAVGDLLVAPTRVVLDGPRGTEVFLNNIGTEPATYRISLELRRMHTDGTLKEVAVDNADAHEQQSLALIRYNPRKIVLPPNQPQAIRVGLIPTPGLADGEYRVHMLFRAIPAAKPVVADGKPTSGIAISLTPVYGITIPVIVRMGNLSAKAAIAAPKLIQDQTGNFLTLKLSRTGTRSVYGRIRVTKSGIDKPLIDARGISVYTEVGEREVRLPIDAATAAQLKGPVKIQYLEETETGGGMLAELQGVIN